MDGSHADGHQANAFLEANIRYLLHHMAGRTTSQSQTDNSVATSDCQDKMMAFEQLGQLLTAGSLAWELHAEQLPLWRHQGVPTSQIRT